MILALERTLEGDPGKTLDSVQKEGLSYLILHLTGVSKYFLKERRNKRKHSFQKYSFHTVKKIWVSKSVDFIEKKSFQSLVSIK